MEIKPNHRRDYSKHILALPGGVPPEKLLFTYVESLLSSNTKGWESILSLDKRFTKMYFISEIKKKIDKIPIKVAYLQSEGKSIKSVEREENKDIFNDYIVFWECVIKCWIEDKENSNEVYSFYNALRTIFLKVCKYYEIDPKKWEPIKKSDAD
ncbi:MAG: hypothetical protein AB9907_08250 [Flexilinea sp.]